MGFLLWLSGLQTRLISLRTQVRSLASLSGLRIQHCWKLWRRLQMHLGSSVAVAVVLAGSYSSDSTPSLELPYAAGAALESKKKKKTKKNKKKQKPKNTRADTLGTYRMPGIYLILINNPIWVISREMEATHIYGWVDI